MITGDFVNGLHLMVGTTSDLDANSKPNVATTSENTFFLVEDSGTVFYYSGGEWAQADAAVAGIVAALLNKGALPAVTATDNGKVLKVVDGVWAPGTGGGGGGGADTFSVAFTQSGSATVCNHTHSEIRAAIAAGKILVPTLTGYCYGVLILSDQIQTEFLFYDDTGGGNFIIVTMASDNSIAATTPGLALEPTKTAVSGATPTINAFDNTIYSCGELTSLTITDSGQNISFVVDFTSGSTPAAIFVPAGYKAPGGDLTPEASKTYELNVRNGKAVLTAFEAVSMSA